MSKQLKPVRGGAWSLSKEYRKEAARRRRVNVGADSINKESRKYYHARIAKLRTMQDGEIPDDGSVEKFVKSRMLRAASWRAKRDGLDFKLTSEDIVLPETCPVSGVALRLTVLGPASRDAYSLDRVNNSLGYVRGNVRVISKEVNAIKGAKDVAFFERLLAYMKGEL